MNIAEHPDGEIRNAIRVKVNLGGRPHPEDSGVVELTAAEKAVLPGCRVGDAPLVGNRACNAHARHRQAARSRASSFGVAWESKRDSNAIHVR